jgi:hypothetical protein
VGDKAGLEGQRDGKGEGTTADGILEKGKKRLISATNVGSGSAKSLTLLS